MVYWVVSNALKTELIGNHWPLQLSAALFIEVIHAWIISSKSVTDSWNLKSGVYEKVGSLYVIHCPCTLQICVVVCVFIVHWFLKLISANYFQLSTHPPYPRFLSHQREIDDHGQPFTLCTVNRFRPQPGSGEVSFTTNNWLAKTNESEVMADNQLLKVSYSALTSSRWLRPSHGGDSEKHR